MKLLKTNGLAQLQKLTLAIIAAVSMMHQVFAGSIARLYYDAVSGSAISNLTSAAIFPESPTFREQLDDFNPPVYGLQSKQDSGTSFGTYIRGYLEAPANGAYIFFIASDDASELWLGTDSTPGSRQLIAFESGSGAPLFSGARLSQRQSAPITLTRGQKYYLEVLHKQNAGSSYLRVGWQRPNGVQEIIPSLHLAQYPLDPYLGRTDPNLPPTFNSFGLNGGDLPTSASTNEGADLVLQVDLIAAQPTAFQWFRNGVIIPGENLSYLQIPSIPAAANGDVIQVVASNAFGTIASSSTTLNITPDTTPPTITLVDPRGNPNGLRVSFSERINPATATNLSNYSLQVQGGTSLSIASAVLLPDQQSVQLTGVFNFQVGTSYQLTVSGVQDQASIPNTISPNPTIALFTFASPQGTTYDFNAGTTNGFNLYGTAALIGGGSYDGSGYVSLTDASPFQRGVLQFTNRGTVDQFRLRFKTRLDDASATPGDGFSVNLAADLPGGTFLQSQEGYIPPSSPNADRFIVAFDNDRTIGGTLSPAISVKWRGVTITNVLTGANGIPALNSIDGHWADVDILLRRGGKLTVLYDGVIVINQLATGFDLAQNAQLEIAAQTGTNYETHWFDDITVNYADSDVGAVGFSPDSPLGNLTVLENRTAHFEVIPTGASPFFYQWYHDGLPIVSANQLVLDVTANAAASGTYWVVVSNEFSQATSVTAHLTVQPDATPPHLLSARGFAGGLNQVQLTFDEPLDPTTATNLATYSLGFLPLYSAHLSSDGFTVTLQTGLLSRNQTYLFSINNLKDRSTAGNALNTRAAFVAEVNYAGEITLDSPTRYWRFDETNGSPSVSSLTAVQDTLTNTYATLNNNPTLGVPGLLASQPENAAIQFVAANNQSISVPNGADLNITSGPWAKKSFEFWFQATSVPAPGTSGLAATAGLYEQGGANRGLALYLWRDPNNLNPDRAQLIFHAWNNASDGAGSPFGATAGLTVPAIYAQSTIQAGQTYHVVAVLDGDSAGTNGNLILYLNGVEVSRVGGVGQIYNHSGDIQIGRGNSLIHTGQSGNLGFFDGAIDELSLYNNALPASRVASHYQAGTLNSQVVGSNTFVVNRIDTLGNPNQVLLGFSKPVAASTATNLANYTLKKDSGAAISITNATLLGGDHIVQLLGNFNFQVNSNYVLSVANITDQSVPANNLVSNPTNVAFSFVAPAGTAYDFNAGLPSGVQIFGAAAVTTSGSYDGSGYLKLTDAASSQNGAVLFNERHDVEQARIRFKARLSDGSTTPAEGFSVNLASDLPSGTFGSPEEGYLPAASAYADRLIISFDNYQNNSGDSSPSISVKWRGVVLTNVLTGGSGIPALSSTDGHWANVDINLQRGGLISVSYDGVTILTNLPTGFESLAGAQIGIGARTTSNYETHWLDDVNINFADGEIGPVSIPSGGQPQNVTTVENQPVTLAVSPVGTSPFAYQWYYNNTLLAGATNRILSFAASTNLVGSYKVKVWNDFSSVTSSVAALTVQTDFAPPVVQQAIALGGALNQVRITFDEAVDPVTATNVSNYSIGSGSLLIYNATLSTNGQQVTLSTSQQQNGQSYTLTINGLRDRAAFPNALYTNLVLQTAVNYSEEVLADAPVRYWHFDETNGVTAYSQLSLLDTLVTAQGTYGNNPILGVPTLVSNLIGGTAVQFNAASSNFVNFPNGSDINNLSGNPGWLGKTVEFWFKANSLPRGGANLQAPLLYKEGGGTRGLGVYLYGTEDTTSPATALLVWNAYNPAKDGLGAQWGVTNSHPELATYVSTSITTNQIYHVVAVLDGSTNLTGHLLLYTNGVLVGTTGGVGQIYNHNTAPRVANGGSFLRHDAITISTSDYFDGLIDELVLYNTALTSARVTAHYQAGRTAPLPSSITPPTFSSILVANNTLIIAWNGSAQLQRATNVAGPYTTLTGFSSPYQESTTNGNAFFRLVR